MFFIRKSLSDRIIKFFAAVMLLGGFINADDSGKIRLNGIMHNETNGFVRSVQDIGIARTENIAKDLNISAIADYFPTKTLFGRIFLDEALSKPRVGYALNTVVLPRQQAIKTLVENPTLMAEVGALLEVIHQEEEYILTLLSDSCMHSKCSEYMRLKNGKGTSWLYPIDKFCTLNKPFNVATFIATTCATAVGTVKMGSWITQWLGYARIPMPEMKYGNVSDEEYEVASNMYKEALNDHESMLHEWSAVTSKIKTWGTQTSTLVYNYFNSYAATLSKQRLLCSVNTIIESAEKLNALCTDYGLTPHYSLSQITDQSGKDLIESLKHSRYKDKKSYFIMKPLVDILLHDFYDRQDQLAQLFITIGEMDTYHAIAQKFVDNQHAHNKFCFVKFLSDVQRPTIKTEGFWNILVKTPVINTIHESRNIMLTGPNAGGKTTSIRALLQNIILAQTFGIAAAEHCTLTPFDVIHSYLNISDDIQKGLSLFASEIKRAQEIVQTAQSLQPHERYFFALDELFTSTVAEDGEQCAYEFIKGLEAHNNLFCIYATHFNKVKELELESAAFVNYKIDDPAILDDGTLKYPFTISKGASRARFALHIARRAGLIK